MFTKHGELAVWERLSAVQANCAIEATLDACLARISNRVSGAGGRRRGTGGGCSLPAPARRATAVGDWIESSFGSCGIGNTDPLAPGELSVESPAAAAAQAPPWLLLEPAHSHPCCLLHRAASAAAQGCSRQVLPLPRAHAPWPLPPPPPPRLQVRERPLNSLGSRIPSWLHMSHIGAPAIASWGCDDDGTSLAPGSSGGRATGRGAGSKKRGTRTHRAKSVLANASIMQMLLHGILQDAL